MVSNCPACSKAVAFGMFSRRLGCPSCHAKLQIKTGLDEFSFDGAFWQIVYLFAVTAMLYLSAFFMLGLWPAMAEKLAWILSLVLSASMVHATLWRFNARLEIAPE